MDRLTEARNLCQLFTAEGFPTRLAGGCVRDRLLGSDPKDFDLATTATPEEGMTLLKSKGYKVIPLALDHGTICMVTDLQSLEITTLRNDVECDGRHAVVSFTNDFRLDAHRRDFTINALFEDADGHIHDFVGGVADLRAQRLCFVDEPDRRIKEDYLRILRYFRFLARFGWQAQDDQLAAIRGNLDGLQKLSAERVFAEMTKLLTAAFGSTALMEMRRNGVLEPLFPLLDANDDKVEQILAAEPGIDRHFAWFSFYHFGRSSTWTANSLRGEMLRMRFSRKLMRDLQDLETLIQAWPEPMPVLKRLLAFHEKKTLPLPQLERYLNLCQRLNFLSPCSIAATFMQGVANMEPAPSIPRKDLLALEPESRGEMVRLVKICWFLGWCRDKTEFQRILRDPQSFLDRIGTSNPGG